MSKNQYKLKLKSKKKCNPYKKGPVEWKNPDYIDFSKKYERKSEKGKETYYPNNLEKYENEFGQTKNLYDTEIQGQGTPNAIKNTKDNNENYLYNNYYYKNDKNNEYFFNGNSLESQSEIDRRNGIFHNDAVDADSDASNEYHYKFFPDKLYKNVQYKQRLN